MGLYPELYGAGIGLSTGKSYLITNAVNFEYNNLPLDEKKGRYR